MRKITRDRNNQNILAVVYLLGSSSPVGFYQVSMQDFDRAHLGMDLGETPTLLEVEWVGSILDGLLVSMSKVGVGKNMRTFWKEAPGSRPLGLCPFSDCL
jgi:hypothetical protein